MSAARGAVGEAAPAEPLADARTSAAVEATGVPEGETVAVAEAAPDTAPETVATLEAVAAPATAPAPEGGPAPEVAPASAQAGPLDGAVPTEPLPTEAPLAAEVAAGNEGPVATPAAASASVASQPATEPLATPATPTEPLQDTSAPPVIDLAARADSSAEMGADTRLSWAARTDVGLVRGHNEDSYLVRNPLFGVCDGMGGHAAGEVASSIAVRAIAEHAPESADDALLGAAVEAANEAVMQGAAAGVGKPGMGCTASCCIVEGTKLAVAHVGDSRIYLLHAGTLVRVTHDHSFVEELVDAGEITADEARVHPSRSIITRALGSDPDMYADHFSLDVERGDRIILCSDGLSSMISDSAIEALAVTSATPAACTDQLVSAALAEGGHDNVSVIVVDVVSDGREEERRRAHRRSVLAVLGTLAAVAAIAVAAFALIVSNSYYIGAYAGYVGIYQGIRGSVFGVELSHLEEASQVSLADLPEATQHQLATGIVMASASEARETIEAYQAQIDEERAKAEQTGSDAQSESADGSVGDAGGNAGPEAAETESSTTAGADASAGGDTTADDAAASAGDASEGGE